MSTDVPSFEDFVRPLLGDTVDPVLATTPLNRLRASDYAVLAWLDDVQSRCPAHVEAALVAQWDTASLRDVYTLLHADADTPGVQPS